MDQVQEEDIVLTGYLHQVQEEDTVLTGYLEQVQKEDTVLILGSCLEEGYSSYRILGPGSGGGY